MKPGSWEAFLVISAIVILFVILKIYLKVTTGWNRSRTCLIGKTAIVTGSNTGIGYYTALDFAQRGARVILACRNSKRAEEARAKIVVATGNPNVVVKIVDLSSLASVRAFAKEITETEEKLDILVNNAGFGGVELQLTSDGLSLTMQINHFGPFLLTNLLIGLLKKSAPSRIVNVASDAATFAKLNINDLNAAPDTFFKKSIDYANTKLCNILFTIELARRLNGSGVETYVVHPGAVQSDFFQNFQAPWKTIFRAVSSMFYKTTEEGAQTSIYVSVSTDVIGKSGKYFADCKKKSLPRSARNPELPKMLWDKSEEFVKLSIEERQLL